MSRDFRPPYRPLTKRLTYFRTLFPIHRDIRIFKKAPQCASHRGDTAESDSDSKGCITLRRQAPRCASHRRVKLCSVHHTAESSDEQFSKKICGVHLNAESSSAVCIIPRSLTLQCASHRGVLNLSSVCFNRRFYKCYFSVMPKDIHTKLIL